jgi:hypothetical protein
MNKMPFCELRGCFPPSPYPRWQSCSPPPPARRRSRAAPGRSSTNTANFPGPSNECMGEDAGQLLRGSHSAVPCDPRSAWMLAADRGHPRR